MLMQNFRVTNKEHYGILWYIMVYYGIFCSGQYFSLFQSLQSTMTSTFIASGRPKEILATPWLI